MKALFAIAQQTIRCGIRSKVFAVLFVLILLAVFLLPTTVSGDGTITTLVQITLTYSLNIIIALISMTTLWLGCTLLSSEIENYTMHMVVVKPCPRWKIWLGKWAGLFAMNGAILIIAAAIVYSLIMVRVYVVGRYSEKEYNKLKQEVLVGRREFRADLPDLEAATRAEFEARKRDGRITGTDNEDDVFYSIKQELALSILRQGVVAPGKTFEWTFSNVRLENEDDIMFLRYRFFTGDVAEVNQRENWMTWAFQVVVDEDEAGNYAEAPELGRNFKGMGGVFYEYATVPGDSGPDYEPSILEFPLWAKQVIDKKNGGKVKLKFYNRGDKLIYAGQAVRNNDLVEESENVTFYNYRTIFQVADGPILMCRVIGFTNNYIRAILMALFLLAFLAALGCTVGGIFSAPVAVFVAVTYLFMGVVAPMAVNAQSAFDDPIAMATGKINMDKMTSTQIAQYYFAKGVMSMAVSAEELNATTDLSEGRLIESKRLLTTFVRVICIRTLIIALIGIAVLTRRELGLVIRRN